MIKFFKKNNNGIITLPTVIVLGMMALAVVVSITAMAFNELLISQGSAQSSNALFYAEAGARDALIKITRDKNYICDGGDCYEVDFGAGGCANNTGCARISVENDGTTAFPKIITSVGSAGASVRTLQVSVILDNGTTDTSLQNGEITATTWTELTN